MAGGEAVTVPVAAASEMQGGGGSTTVSDDQEQQLENGQGDELGHGHAGKQSNGSGGGASGDLWPTDVVDSLIDQFEDIKVLKLNMGNLRSQHWCDIALTLNSSFKTSYDWKQCKNKVDLLIRLYKKSKKRLVETGSPTTWRFFDRMDSILGRTFKLSAPVGNSKHTRSTAAAANLNNNNNSHSNDKRITPRTSPRTSPVDNTNNNNMEVAEEDEDDENDEPPEQEDEQQRTVSSPRTSERADEIDFRAITAPASGRKKKKSGRSSTSSAINLLVGALNNYTQAFERCKQLEIEAQMRMTQESRAFQLQIAEMQLEVTKEIVRVLGKRRRS